MRPAAETRDPQTAANFVQQTGFFPAFGTTCYALTFAAVNCCALTVAMLHGRMPPLEVSCHRPSACHSAGNLLYSGQEPTRHTVQHPGSGVYIQLGGQEHMSTDSEKWRRMALRREHGSQVPSRQKRPYAPAGSYLVAHACFSCRKSFKVRPRTNAVTVCPQCGNEVHCTGRSFRVPAMGNTEQWRKVQSLYAHGFRFFSYRSYPDVPHLPELFTDVASFVAANPSHPFRVAPPNQALLPVSKPALPRRRGSV